jgi:hypothetical protein
MKQGSCLEPLEPLMSYLVLPDHVVGCGSWMSCQYDGPPWADVSPAQQATWWVPEPRPDQFTTQYRHVSPEEQVRVPPPHTYTSTWLADAASQFVSVIVRENPGIVPLTGDKLRQFHPAYEHLMEHDPVAMPNATAQASAAWVRMSIDHARANRYGLLLEGTFRDPAMTMDTAREFAEFGYRVHLVALGVNERVSRLDTVNRYLGPGGDTNRWTPDTAHDLGYRMTPHTVRAAEDSPYVHRITVTDRSGGDLFTNTRTPDGDWSGPTGAVRTLLALREQPMGRDAARDRLSRRNDYTAVLVERGEVGTVTRPTFERLHADADTVVDEAARTIPERRRHSLHRADQRFHRHVLDSSAEGGTTFSIFLPAAGPSSASPHSASRAVTTSCVRGACAS